MTHLLQQHRTCPAYHITGSLKPPPLTDLTGDRHLHDHNRMDFSHALLATWKWFPLIPSLSCGC